MHIPANLPAMLSLFCLTELTSPDILLTAIYFIFLRFKYEIGCLCYWDSISSSICADLSLPLLADFFLFHPVYLIVFMCSLCKTVKMVFEVTLITKLHLVLRLIFVFFVIYFMNFLVPQTM